MERQEERHINVFFLKKEKDKEKRFHDERMKKVMILLTDRKKERISSVRFHKRLEIGHPPMENNGDGRPARERKSSSTATEISKDNRCAKC